MGFCREVWLLFCVGENGKRWDFSHVLGFFFFGYIPFCFASCMVAGIFGLVKEWRDFLFRVSEDVKRRDFWGSILKACSEVVWGLGVGVESKIPFLRYFFLNVIYATFFLKGIIIYFMYRVGYPI